MKEPYHHDFEGPPSTRSREPESPGWPVSILYPLIGGICFYCVVRLAQIYLK